MEFNIMKNESYKPDHLIAICECGHSDYAYNYEKEVEEDGFHGFHYSVLVCPECPDAGPIVDYIYPKED